MQADGWNHNVHYHDRLLASVPRPCTHALDVGCGLGEFARRLSSLSLQVVAIDAGDEVIDQARRLSAEWTNLRFVTGDFLSWSTGDRFDFISMIAVLHHLPLGPTLTKAADLLGPGGVLAVLGLDRPASIVHASASALIAWPFSGYYRATRPTSPVGAPVSEPTMTLAEIRREARRVLPGARIRRHVLWRYSLIWTK